MSRGEGQGGRESPVDEKFLRGETLRVGVILAKTDLTGFLL